MIANFATIIKKMPMNFGVDFFKGNLLAVNAKFL